MPRAQGSVSVRLAALRHGEEMRGSARIPASSATRRHVAAGPWSCVSCGSGATSAAAQEIQELMGKEE